MAVSDAIQGDDTMQRGHKHSDEAIAEMFVCVRGGVGWTGGLEEGKGRNGGAAMDECWSKEENKWMLLQAEISNVETDE